MGAVAPTCCAENAGEAREKTKDEMDESVKMETDTAVVPAPAPLSQPEAEPEEESQEDAELLNARMFNSQMQADRIKEAGQKAKARKEDQRNNSKSFEMEPPTETVAEEPSLPTTEEKQVEKELPVEKDGARTGKDTASKKKKTTSGAKTTKKKTAEAAAGEKAATATEGEGTEKKSSSKKSSSKKPSSKETAGEPPKPEKEASTAPVVEKAATMSREELKKREQEWKKRPAKEQEQLGKQLREAAKAGNVAEVTNLLSSGVWPNAPDKDGWTPLMKAAEVGQTSTAEVLLQNGADARAVLKLGEWGCSALHFAARNGHREVAELIAGQSDLKGKNYKGKTAAETAKDEGHSDLAKMLKGMAKKQG